MLQGWICCIVTDFLPKWRPVQCSVFLAVCLMCVLFRDEAVHATVFPTSFNNLLFKSCSSLLAYSRVGIFSSIFCWFRAFWLQIYVPSWLIFFFLFLRKKQFDQNCKFLWQNPRKVSKIEYKRLMVDIFHVPAVLRQVMIWYMQQQLSNPSQICSP